MSQPTDPAAVVRAYVAAMNAGDQEALQRLFTDDAQVWGVLGFGGLDVALPVWRDLHEALEMELVVEDLAVEGDRVAVRYVERGRHVAPFRGREPTGNSYELVAMEWFELEGGRIRRRWGARDGAAQARQLGWT